MKKQILLSLLSGFLVALSFPKWNLYPLAWVSLVPLLFALPGTSFRRAASYGFLTGLAAFCSMLYWIVPTFRAAGLSWSLGIASTFLLSGYIALFYALFAALAGKYFLNAPADGFAKRTAGIFFSAALWVALEFARGHLFTGFPWGLLGYSQWRFLPILQAAEWTGVYGVSFLIILSNLSLFSFLQCLLALRRNAAGGGMAPVKIRSSLLYIDLPLILIFSLILWGHRRLRHDFSGGEERPLSVAVLQGNIDQYKKWSPEFISEILSAYGELASLAGGGGSGTGDALILWPETALPGWYPGEERLARWLGDQVRRSGRFNLLGAVTRDGEKNHNAAFLFDPSGKVVGRYDKMHLVPFGEFVPAQNLLGRWIPVLNALGGFDPGVETRLLDLGGRKIGATICYEAIFPEIVAGLTRRGAQILVNLTNDGWYLDTAAPEQHFAMNVLRAVENRRTLVRAANTGISGIIAPSGRVLERTALNERALLAGEAEPVSSLTFYAAHGDLFAWGCLFVSIFGLGLEIRRRRTF